MAKSVEFTIVLKQKDGGVVEHLTAEVQGLQSAIDKVAEDATSASQSLRDMASQSLVFETAIRSLGDLSNMVNALSADYNQFETAMRGVNTMAGMAEGDFKSLTSQVKDLSEQIPLARNELANGLYQVISNGVPEDNWLSFLSQSSRAAVGGIADLGETVTVTATLIKNYGLSWQDAALIQDKIQTTAKNGVTSFEQLAQALPRVSGSAAQLGVSMDELMAVFATTTGVTGNTAEVSTQLAAVLSALIKPSAEATKAANEMGIGFNAASIEAAGGLQNFLLALSSTVDDYAARTGSLSQTIYSQLFGSAEAMRLLGSISGEQREKFAQNIDAMSNSAGTIDTAFNEMSQTGDSARQMFENQCQAIKDWVGSIASASAPYTSLIADSGAAVMSLIQLSNGVRTAIASMRSLQVATLAQTAAARASIAVTRLWQMVQAAFNVVLSANPIGAAVIAIAALVTSLIAAYNNSERFRSVCDNLFSIVHRLSSAVADRLTAAFSKVSAAIHQAWSALQAFFGFDDSPEQQQTNAINNNTAATNANLAAKIAAAQASLKQNKALNAPSNSSSSAKNLYDGKHLINNAQSYQALANNIIYYQNQLKAANAADTEAISLYTRKIQALQRQQEAIAHLQEKAARPDELHSLKDIDDEIAYQQSLRQRASIQEIAQIDTEIGRLNSLKTAFELQSHQPLAINDIQSYRQLDEEVQHYTNLLQNAAISERAAIQQHLNDLNKLRQAWDNALSEGQRPREIGSLNSLKDLDDALNFYHERQQQASADELLNISRTVSALQQKRDALNSIANLPAIEQQLDRLDSLSGKELTVELKAVGLNQIQQQIKALQLMPVSDNQQTLVNGLISRYEVYEKKLRASSVSLQDSYRAMRGIGDGVSSLTSALQSNGNAWQMITSVVDSALHVYSGIASLIDIIQSLAAATSAANTATAVSGTVATAAATEKSAAATGEVTAAVSTLAAVKAEAMAYRELAASEFMAAHAAIPFVGAGIAAGFIATMQAVVGSVAVTPFANGGIVYGPTLALMGEYAGAQSNPEVIAPLSRLKDLIGNNASNSPGSISLKIRGRDLVGVIANDTRINRHPSNIKL